MLGTQRYMCVKSPQIFRWQPMPRFTGVKRVGALVNAWWFDRMRCAGTRRPSALGKTATSTAEMQEGLRLIDATPPSIWLPDLGSNQGPAD